MNLTELTYGDPQLPVARQLATAICKRDPSLDLEKTTELCKALHEACYG
jgi:hypothetical protein